MGRGDKGSWVWGGIGGVGYGGELGETVVLRGEGGRDGNGNLVGGLGFHTLGDWDG